MNILDTIKKEISGQGQYHWFVEENDHAVFVCDASKTSLDLPLSHQFKANPRVELTDNGYQFKLLEPIDFYFYMDTSGNVFLHDELDDPHYYVHVIVKPDFDTDFVSSPKMLWWFQSPLGPAAKPSLLHDLFYRKPINVPGLVSIPGLGEISQRQADVIFYEGLLLRGVNRIKSYLMYIGLRLFGAINFHARYRKENS